MKLLRLASAALCLALFAACSNPLASASSEQISHDAASALTGTGFAGGGTR
jgi:hypothetical protein